jgi:anti-sigma factor RsiW
MMRKKCRKNAARLVAYLDGELAGRQARDMAEHLRECPACSEALAELQSTTKLLEAWQDTPAPSDDFDQTFWQKIAVLRNHERAHKARGMRTWLSELLSTRSTGLAASAVCAICILVASLFMVKSKTGVPEDSVALARDFELYDNLDVIENSEALEYFDVIAVLDVLEKDTKG